MKKRYGFAFGAGLSLVVACGGSSSGDGSAGAPAASGAAGSTSGGSGASNGGKPNGGAGGSQATGGNVSAGGANAGTSTGGSATGGDASGSCEMDEDCTSYMFPTAPQKAADCYCTGCANKPLSKSACTANQMAFGEVCKNVIRPCPRIACLPPPSPACAQHLCVGAK